MRVVVNPGHVERRACARACQCSSGVVLCGRRPCWAGICVVWWCFGGRCCGRDSHNESVGCANGRRGIVIFIRLLIWSLSAVEVAGCSFFAFAHFARYHGMLSSKVTGCQDFQIETSCCHVTSHFTCMSLKPTTLHMHIHMHPSRHLAITVGQMLAQMAVNVHL